MIQKVPIVVPGQHLTVLGSGFGSSQGDSYLLYAAGDRQIALRGAVEWSDRKVVTLLPEHAASGSVQLMERNLLGYQASEAVPFVVQADELPSQPGRDEVPVQEGAPWPLFRRDHRNTGRSPLRAVYNGEKPWSFQTGKGIFSTPIIDSRGTIYVGSADHFFYAINPDGTERWRFQTGEIIDSAGVLPRADHARGVDTVIVPSGDGHLYFLRTDDAFPNPSDRLLWTFDARVSPRASYNNWFEGNVAIGYDGTLYAGNTNFNYYAIRPDGGLQWTYETGANNWSIAGLGDDGTLYWGSNDTLIRAVRPDGKERWTKRTWGFIAASAAIGSDGTVYLGSFDSYFYALDADTGAVRWTFKTNDHIYTSAALGAGMDGKTNAIYFGSTDGSLYALDPDGKLLWKYDTGDPIRSSPALGAGADGQGAGILYFGSGNGKLYALNAADGTRRWSFDTTSHEPERRDRNDLNASVALGSGGIYIGGEDGNVWYLPYDYCLHAADERCQTDAREDLPEDMAGLFYVTPGGSTEREPPRMLSPATIITLRLVVRERGATVDAFFCKTPLLCPADRVQVRTEPPFRFQAVQSADGRYLHIIPEQILDPNETYRVAVTGDYYTGGIHFGNLTLGGHRQGRFEGRITFRTAAPGGSGFPMAVRQDEVGALEWTRLALPIPTMMPSLNQIGFDYMDWIIGAVDVGAPDERGAGKVILWAIGGRWDADGTLVADPQSEFMLPLSGTYRGDAFILTNRDFTMPVTGIPIPFNLFQLRGQLGSDLVVKPGATTYADARALSIPTFGPYLVLAGLANDLYQKLVVTGTYVTRPYAADGPANKRPAGVEIDSVTYTPPVTREAGKVIATVRIIPGAQFSLAEHRPGILLIDASKAEAVALNYRENLTVRVGDAGKLGEISLNIPAGMVLPADLQAIVMIDVFPLYRQKLEAAL
ncbi:MAG: PQQ-binding-like beta-propeller repeat protein [Candidatus Binatia bacterium]